MTRANIGAGDGSTRSDGRRSATCLPDTEALGSNYLNCKRRRLRDDKPQSSGLTSLDDLTYLSLPVSCKYPRETRWQVLLASLGAAQARRDQHLGRPPMLHGAVSLPGEPASGL